MALRPEYKSLNHWAFKEIIGEYFCDLNIGKDFLDYEKTITIKNELLTLNLSNLRLLIERHT